MISKLFLVFPLFLTYLITTSCSTSAIAGLNSITYSGLKKDSLINITITGTISSSIEGQIVSANCKLILVGTDSASMILTGPMGMLVGRLYSTNDYFSFYNTISSEAFEGRPTAYNLNKILKVPLNFKEFSNLIRNEIPKSFDSYSKSNLENNKILLKNSNDTSYVEYCLFDEHFSKMEQYQRKRRDGSMLMNVVFNDFVLIENFWLPQKYIMKFPTMNGNVTINVDEIKVNSTISQSFLFVSPKNYTKYILD